MRMIEVPITECDVEMFKDIVYKNTTFEWIFQDTDGNDVCVRFMSEDELKQRSR